MTKIATPAKNKNINKHFKDEEVFLKITIDRDFPGGTVVKNPPSNAWDSGSIPGQGTRSHMHAATKSSHATTKEPTGRN